MINKSADLRDNALGIIIAVIGILLLLSVSYSIYSGINKETETSKASSLVDTLEIKINALKENQITETIIRGISNENPWHLTGWDKTMIGRPDKCFTETCICVCPNPSYSSCQDKGICRELKKIEEIKLPEHSETFSQSKNDKLGIGPRFQTEIEGNYIKLPSKLIKIQIEKKTENEKTTLIISEN